MSEETAKPTKTTRGPEAKRLKIQGDWKDAVLKSFTKKIPKRSQK